MRKRMRRRATRTWSTRPGRSDTRKGQARARLRESDGYSRCSGTCAAGSSLGAYKGDVVLCTNIGSGTVEPLFFCILGFPRNCLCCQLIMGHTPTRFPGTRELHWANCLNRKQHCAQSCMIHNMLLNSSTF